MEEEEEQNWNRNSSISEISGESSNEHVNGTATEENEVADALANFLAFYYTPAVFSVGSIGNILSVIVFCSGKLRKLSSSYYLVALAVSDTCFLFSVMAPWLTFLNINLYNQNFYCQLIMYLNGLCNFLSVWFIVAFTTERFIAILFPLRRHSMCTVQRAKLVLVAITMIGLLVNFPYFAYTAPRYDERYNVDLCNVKEKFEVS